MPAKSKLKKFSIGSLLLIIVLAATGWVLENLWRWLPGDECLVTKVYDGDTVTLNCRGEKVKVRLHCLDAPEIAQKPWGELSRDHLRGLVGRSVTLEPLDTDRYGRTVGVLRHDGQNLNLRLVSDGMAAVYPRYCDQQAYYEAESGAKADSRGIWTQGGLQQTPWRWRKQQRGS